MRRSGDWSLHRSRRGFSGGQRGFACGCGRCPRARLRSRCADTRFDRACGAVLHVENLRPGLHLGPRHSAASVHRLSAADLRRLLRRCSPPPAARRSARWRPASGSSPADVRRVRVPLGHSVVRAAAISSRRCRRGWAFCRRSSARSGARCTIGSPTPASSKRDSPRRLHRDGRATAATFPIAPGTVGSAAGLVVYLLVWWTQSPIVEVGAHRRALRRRRLGRHDSRAVFRRHRSRARS